jgi:hypothetical protein
MKTFTVPKSVEGITLKQYVQFYTAKTDIEKVAAATQKTIAECEQLQITAIEQIINLFVEACQTGTSRHEQTFFDGAVRLGFIPDLNALTFKEYVDIDSYTQQIYKQPIDPAQYKYMIDLFAVLFRPVKEIWGKHYTLEPYDVTKVSQYKDCIERITMDRVNGALVFFSTIANELMQDSLTYLEKELEKAIVEITA